MIIKANTRASGQELAAHLLKVEDNEHVTVHDIRGFVGHDLHNAMQEAEAISRATKCQKYLFSVSLNPPENADVCEEDFEDAASRIEIEFDLIGQPRAMVLHEKEGRIHAHCVWSVIDTEEMKAIHLSFYKRRMMGIAHDLYLEHGWDMPNGLRPFGTPDPNNYKLAEYQQAKRARKDPGELKALMRQCWEQSDSSPSFQAALHEHCLVIASGDRRPFVAVDETGEAYSLTRMCGVKTKALKERLGDPDDYPDIETAHEFAMETGRKRQEEDRKDAQKQLIKRRNQAIAKAKEQMIAQHRDQRKELLDKQKTRANEEALARAQRFETGLKLVWEFLSGKRAKIRKENEEAARLCKIRDLEERQSLRVFQIKQNRTLIRQEVIINTVQADNRWFSKHKTDSTPTIPSSSTALFR